MSFTLIIIIVTALTSIAAFNRQDVYDKLILWPRTMNTPVEYYRLLSSGFIHADWMHLFFNMFTLFFFGENVELAYLGNGWPGSVFLLLYLGGIIVASLPSFIKNRNNSYYRSLGASGGVAAVLFSYVYFAPWSWISIWFIPVPAILAGAAYLIYSAVMSKKGRNNVNHDAHFWGAVYGFVFTFLFDPTHGSHFLDAVMSPHFR